MILLFIRLTEAAIVRMEEAIKLGDLAKLSEEAHKMAGSCEQIGADQLYTLIRQLEEDARQGAGTGLIRSVFESVKAEANTEENYP
jgi:HPt (histidine-containing phosphotransfer) domain-containing protein